MRVPDVRQALKSGADAMTDEPRQTTPRPHSQLNLVATLRCEHREFL
jgi:hypothetical protein